MKFVFVIICLLICALHSSVSAQTISSSQLSESYRDKISAFTAQIINKNRTDRKSLKILFHKAHREFLKNYKAYATVKDVFENGNFDCLSGAYFFSLCLKDLGIKSKIIETNYHIFLIAETNQGEVLLESTDRYTGFVTSKKKIETQISNYKANTSVNETNQLYLSGIKIYHELLPNQLLGLFNFNQAVVSFHKNDLIECSKYLESAWQIYDNPRIEAFTPILIHSILLSQLDESQKRNLISTLKSHQSKYSQTLAIR
jgi:hypothetical protein